MAGVGEPDAVSAECYNPPLTVHVFWSGEGGNALRSQVGCALYESLCRPLDANVAVRPVVGIPVRIGIHAEYVAAAVKQALAERDSAGSPDESCVVAVPVLDSAARIDQRFCDVIADLWAARGPRVLVLPVVLGASWSVPNHLGACRLPSRGSDALKVERAVAQVSVGICHFLMGLAKPGPRRRVQILVSHAEPDLAEMSHLAGRLRDHIGKTNLQAFFEVNDVARDRSLSQQLDDAGAEAVFLSRRTDAYSEIPSCLDDVLTAKKHGVPIVCVQALSQTERRSLAYGGNAFTYVSRKRRETEDLTALCLQAWLRHLHFHHTAPRVFKMRGLPLEPRYLSRPPELIDFAQNLLPPNATTLIVYPDPPLPQAEIGVIRSAYPKVRLATPATLHRELLRRVASPPLDGVRVALSLSGSPDLPKFATLSSAQTKPEPRGLTDKHMDDAVTHLTSSLVGAGAELGYGGDLSDEGFTQLLSSLIEAHKRTTKTSRELLFNYIAAYLWNAEAAERIKARFIRIDAACSEESSSAVKQALQLAAMRKRMAAECHARVILGGKTTPKRAPDDKAGYSGRLPGQAEEAWNHLQAEKPLYVAGGFGGCAHLVVRALCGETSPLPTEAASQRVSDYYRIFCGDFDHEAERQGVTLPAGLDALWAFFAERGAGFFHGNGADESKLWLNGLTVAENRCLFASTHPEEISTLVLLGLLRLREERRGKGTAPLKVMLYRGSISAVPDVDSYAVLVLRGAPLRGADGALDAATDGAIQRHLEQQRDDALVAVGGGRLSGDWVILQTAGDLTRLDPLDALGEKQWLIDRITRGMADVVSRAQVLGLDSPALVPFGINLGLGVRDSVCAMLQGLIASNAGSYLTSVALCEVDPERYQEIIALKKEIESSDPGAVTNGDLHQLAGKVQFTELRSDSGPALQASSRPAILLDVRRRDDALIVHTRAAGSGTAIPIEEKAIDWRKIMTLTHAFGDGQPPDFEMQQNIGSRLADAVLPAQARAALDAHPGTPIDILHDIEAAAIPFEMLCLTTPGAPSPHWPAREGGIRRCLLAHNIPRRQAIHSRGLRLRLLLVADPRGDLEHAREEAGRIRAAFASRSDVIVDPLTGPAEATFENVLAKLKTCNFDILHFAGHAKFDARDPAQSGLTLAGGKLLRAQDLIAAQLRELPALIVLNACEAGRVRAEAPDPPPEQQSTRDASLAETLIGAGLQGFIGNLWRVEDRAAANFSVELYTALAGGASLGEALLSARRKLFAANQRDWLNYMFFGEAGLKI